MPELPEVETTRLGIIPTIEHKKITDVKIYNASLRWPVPADLARCIKNHHINRISRRSKYLLFEFDHGTMLLHLGMSGSLRLKNASDPVEPYEHVEFIIDNKHSLRLRDPRRFGAVLWTNNNVNHHALIKNLGPEPLEDTFNHDYLFEKSRKRKASIKDFLMNSHIVSGLGNIYVNEALFVAGIRPVRVAGKITHAECRTLVQAIKKILKKSIRAGGTTLRDFSGSSGEPGYFSQKLLVYGRENEECPQCGTAIKRIIQGQRSSYYCKKCQK